MAGSMPGKKLMGLSLKRAGDNMIEATGKPGSIDSKPMSSGGSERGKALMAMSLKRNGDNTIMATGRPGAAGECPKTCC
jgi:hypothetical protein